MIVIRPEKPKESLLKTAARGVAAVIGLCLFVVVVAKISEMQPQPAPARPPTVVPPMAHESLALSGEAVTRSPGGALYLLSGRLTNDADAERRDVRIRCDQIGNSGSTIRSHEATLFEVVPAKGVKQFRRLQFGLIDDQARTVSCRVVAARY